MKHSMSRSERWGRVLAIVSVLLLAWAALIAVTGGFLIELGPLRVSSRNATRVTVLAVIAAALAWRLAYRGALATGVRLAPSIVRRIDAAVLELRPSFVRAAPTAVSALAAAVLACGIAYGSRVAAGADGFGYLSASVLWAKGLLGVDLSATAALP